MVRGQRQPTYSGLNQESQQYAFPNFFPRSREYLLTSSLNTVIKSVVEDKEKR